MGSFLTEFGVTVAVAVIVSLVVALSLTPMLASRMPPPEARRPGSIYERLEGWFQGLETSYGRVLDWTLANRAKTVGIAVASIALAVLAGRQLEGEFFPSGDSGFISVEFRTPPGTSLESTVAILQQNEDWMLEQPEVASVFAAIGPTSVDIGGPSDGQMTVRLHHRDRRERSADDIMREARVALSRIPGQEFSITNPMGSSDRDFQVEIVGSATLEELWSLFRFLMPGLLGSESAFRERFARPIEGGDVRARKALRARVRPYVLRRLKRQVATELPPLTEIVERCPLEAPQRNVYETVRLTAHRDVQDALSRGSGSTMQVLEALLRMRQACCDPGLLPGDVGNNAGAAKLDRMEEILVELVGENHRALVFSQWTSLLDRVEVRLQELGIPWVRLDGTTRDRQAVIDQFQADDGPPVFLLSLKAGGFGLNLTAADYVLHLDPWWNPAVERQATDRAHRIGQERPVVSIKLVAEGTVEERILDLQAAKRDLADAALGTEGGFLRALSAQELRSLFEAA